MRFVLFLLLSVVVHSSPIIGKVVGVSDGDTITVLISENVSVKVRLYGIDAPESKQAFGQRAKQELSNLVFQRIVAVEVKQKDRYGRTVGLVTVDSTSVNVKMIREGFAWWQRVFMKETSGK